MGACRELQDVFFHLFSRYGDKKRVFTLKFWRGEYVWHDTFGVRFNRWIKCKIFGHAELKNVSDYAGEYEGHCFDCGTTVVKENVKDRSHVDDGAKI